MQEKTYPRVAKIRDLLNEEIEFDFYGMSADRGGVAFCGPQKLTEKGYEHYEKILDLELRIMTDNDGYHYAFLTGNIPLSKVDRFEYKVMSFFLDVAGCLNDTVWREYFLED